jgi:serine carboxypeptidase-like clade 2
LQEISAESIILYIFFLKKMRSNSFAMAAAVLAAVGYALPIADKVESLYMMPDLSFGLYSGYLGVDGSSKQLHYVTALSQNNWQTDPVIVWFSGGPGCSSMVAWLQEHGPYNLEDGVTTLVKN